MYDNYSRIWTCINGYNGYEWSNDGLLRSMKNFNKYPQGNLIRKYVDKKGEYFILSDNSNNRVKLYIDEIIKITTDPSRNQLSRGQYQTDIGSRNMMLIKKKKKSKIDLKENIGIPKFNFLLDTEPENNVQAIYFFLK